MDFLNNKCVIFMLIFIAISITSNAKADDGEDKRPVTNENTSRTTTESIEDLRISLNGAKSRVKRQFGYDPYYDYGRRRIYPYPPIIFGGIGFGGFGFGRGFGGRGFGGRGFGGRGFGGRGFGGRGFGGRGIGGRGGIGGFGGGRGGGRG